MNGFHAIGTRAELAFAAFLFALGAIAAWNGWAYGIGQWNDIGPGAFPFGLGVVLMALAALAAREAGASGPIERRLAPAMMLLPGIILWALLIEPVGLIGATLVLCLCYSLAEERLNILQAALLALALCAVGYVVFILGFHLNIKLLGGLI